MSDASTTRISDHDAANIRALITQRGWQELDEYDRIGAAYTFVKDEIEFGYNESDDVPASRVLAQGYGQCNTKGNLLFALLRALDVECRVHGFTIHKDLQRGAIPWWMYPLAPPEILHSWIEVKLGAEWLELEGFILDEAYLRSLQARFRDRRGAFCGWGAATPDLQNPEVEWRGRSTYIQRDGIARDFGVFDTPDELYRRHGTNLTGLKRIAYSAILRHAMNRTVDHIRRSTHKLPETHDVAPTQP